MTHLAFSHRKARLIQICSICDGYIEPGETYAYWVRLEGKEFCYDNYCDVCGEMTAWAAGIMERGVDALDVIELIQEFHDVERQQRWNANIRTRRGTAWTVDLGEEA